MDSLLKGLPIIRHTLIQVTWLLLVTFLQGESKQHPLTNPSKPSLTNIPTATPYRTNTEQSGESTKGTLMQNEDRNNRIKEISIQPSLHEAQKPIQFQFLTTLGKKSNLKDTRTINPHNSSIPSITNGRIHSLRSEQKIRNQHLMNSSFILSIQNDKEKKNLNGENVKTYDTSDNITFHVQFNSNVTNSIEDDYPLYNLKNTDNTIFNEDQTKLSTSVGPLLKIEYLNGRF